MEESADHFRGLNVVSRDSMLKLMARNPTNEEREAGEDEEIELSLGLSMNGRFGVDPTRKKLSRSSSVSNVVATNDSVGNGSNPQAGEVAFGSDAPLVRACSMPSETQERRRPEEIQSARSTENLENVGLVNENPNCSEFDGGSGLHAGSTGVSDLQGQLGKEATQNPLTKAPELAAESLDIADTDIVIGDEESLRKALIDMPYVSTRGDGPNHEKIEGFLYQYKRGEDLKIVCVCHGFFLSPGEFVKHGGGGDVAYPLKHIVVSPFPYY